MNAKSRCQNFHVRRARKKERDAVARLRRTCRGRELFVLCHMVPRVFVGGSHNKDLNARCRCDQGCRCSSGKRAVAKKS